MKLLVIASYLPYPLDSGGNVRLYNLLLQLSKLHSIALICEIRPNQTQSDRQALEKICTQVITVPRNKQWSMQNILRSGLSTNSFLVTGHTSEKMREAIDDALAKTAYDLVHVETYYVLQNITQKSLHNQKSGKPIPVVVAEHNIEYSVYEKYAAKLALPFRILLNVDIAKIKNEEERAWKTADKVLAVSFEDRMVMEKAGIRPVVVPNGVDTTFFRFKPKLPVSDGEKRLLFLGNYKWIQNVDAVKFLIEEIWPEIKKHNDQNKMKLWIVGRHIPQSLKRLTNDPDVLFDEQSSEKTAPALFEEAALLVAPLRVGGGTSYKILEAMSSGTPVVTMSMSAQAIGAKDDKELLVGDSAASFAHKCVSLLADKQKYERIAKDARALIEKNYTWEIIAKNLEQAYKEAVYN